MSEQEVPAPLQLVLDKLRSRDKRGDGVRQTGPLTYSARCPAHDDESPSLSISWGKKHKVVLFDHAGCHEDTIIDALGLRWKDLEQPSRIVATYDYTDEEGDLFYQVVRFEPKSFRPRRPDPSKRNSWIWNLDGVEPVPYKVPELLAAVDAGDPVYIVEGEKDVEAMMQAYGVVATCNSGGAGKWGSEHSAWFRGSSSNVTIVADRDKAGYRHAVAVHRSLAAVGIEATIVQSAVGKDAADHCGDHGLEEFDALSVSDAIALTDPAESGDSTESGDFDQRVAARVEDLRVYRAAERQYAAEEAASRGGDPASRVHRGGDFMLDAPDAAEVLWGRGDGVLWARGEALMVAGSDGVGKSLILQQLMLARAGLFDTFLNLPVLPAEGRVLYLAMDRPQQIRRSLRRMAGEDHRAVLNDRLVVWQGPTPIDVLAGPGALADWIADDLGGGFSDVYVDSYKDLAAALSDDKVGSAVNSAMQEVLARGMEWVGVHHTRKPSADRAADYGLASVYGSRWLTAGAGSVVLVLGQAGDTTVELRHVKQPGEVVGPLTVLHDQKLGRSSVKVAAKTVTAALVEADGEQMTVRELVQELYGNYSEATRKRVEREAKNLVRDRPDVFGVVEGTKGGAAGSTPARYFCRTETNARPQRPRGSG